MDCSGFIIDDAIAFCARMRDMRLSGQVNAVCPQGSDQPAIAQHLARALRRPAVARRSGEVVLRAGTWGDSDVIVDGQRRAAAKTGQGRAPLSPFRRCGVRVLGPIVVRAKPSRIGGW